MSSKVGESILAGIKTVPELPVVVTELLAQFNREVVDFAAVERLFHRDPALASGVLRLANSPFFGFSGRIGSLREACLVLGVQSLRQMVTAAAVRGQFTQTGTGVLDRKQLWQHNLATAAASGVLAKDMGVEPGEAFTAGLLHDLGKLGLDAWFPETYRLVVAHQREHGCPLHVSERVVLGITHADVGARLAHRWHFPEPLVAAVAHHHTLEVRLPLVDVVHVADVLATALMLGDGGDGMVTPLDAGAWGRLGLKWEALPGLFAEIERLHAQNPFRVES